MKKYLAFLCAAAAMLFAVSCSDNDDPVPPSPTPEKTYLQIMKEDINIALDKFPDFRKESKWDYPYGYFRTAQYFLNGNVSDLSIKELKAVKVTYGFDYITSSPDIPEAQHILEATRDFTKGLDADMTYQKAMVPGYPYNFSLITNLDKIISLEHALRNAKLSGVTLPKSDNVQLCRPETPAYGANPIYRFDTAPGDKFIIYVDAVTGEVRKTRRN